MILRGRQVVLRDFELSDLDRYEHWLAAGHEWRRWDGPYHRPPDRKAIDHTIWTVRNHIEQGTWLVPRIRMVVADAESDRLIGCVARYWISEETRWVALGIDIYDPKHWGRGIGFEALGLWIDYQFGADESLRRLDLQTWSGNERMVRLAHKLGFAEEARFRQARQVDGETYDALGFGILRSEWEQRYPEGFRVG